MIISQSHPSLRGLHIFTYDIHGVILKTGQKKESRQTGLVTQTHQLLNGIIKAHPSLKLAITQTGAKETFQYQLQIPEGKEVFAQGITSRFPDYLTDPATGGKDKALVNYYYEQKIYDKDNPIYHSLGKQYADAVYNVGVWNLIMQNPNPIVSLLKAEELGYIDPITLHKLNVVGVIHDIEGYLERIKYVRQRFNSTKMDLRFIAISSFVRSKLIEMGFPPHAIATVPNGMNIDAFKESITTAKRRRVFNEIAARNSLPHHKKLILVSARRVEHKGHLDVIEAVSLLKRQHKFDNFYVAFTGKNMLNTQALHFESQLEKAIEHAGLADDIFLLDDLSSLEVAACFDKAYLSILASTEPEGFAYVNIESMIAGTPVITTRLGGPMDYIIDGETGLFVEPHSPGAIAHSIDILSQDAQLYDQISQNGAKKAEEYGLERMAQSYLDVAITQSSAYSPTAFSFSNLKEIGEGMHTKVYEDPLCDERVIQILKKEHELEIGDLRSEYEYLRDAYKSLPCLIPDQRFVTLENAGLVDNILILKERVYANSQYSLLTTEASLLSRPLISQIEQFIGITRNLFAHGSTNPTLGYLGPRVPDIIDPNLDNLVIDNHGNLRLIDTNKTISTKHLVGLVQDGQKLNVKNKKIHALLLKRMLYLEYKFTNKNRKNLLTDPFYCQYLDDRTLIEFCDDLHITTEPSIGLRRTPITGAHAG